MLFIVGETGLIRENITFRLTQTAATLEVSWKTPTWSYDVKFFVSSCCRQRSYPSTATGECR